eukprot:scaffold7131_cov131-Isochrysis_galbana.AAC.2
MFILFWTSRSLSGHQGLVQGRLRFGGAGRGVEALFFPPEAQARNVPRPGPAQAVGEETSRRNRTTAWPCLRRNRSLLLNLLLSARSLLLNLPAVGTLPSFGPPCFRHAASF